jgi:hypothetical protein
VPLERPRAIALLTGLLVFALGFAVAGVLVLAERGASPAYYVAVTIGFFGIGIVGLFLNRGTVPLPDGPIWSRVGLQALGRALQVPAVLLMVVFYGLVAFGVLANFVVPVFVR